MILLTVLNILVCAGTLATVLAVKKEVKGLSHEVTDLYDIIEQTESAVYRSEDKQEKLEKDLLEIHNKVSLMIDGNSEMFEIVEKIDKSQSEDLEELKGFIKNEHGKLHMKIAFTPLKVVQVGGQDGRA